MKCPNYEKCQTELTEMDTGCKRCLTCNPLTKYVAPAKKQRRDIDLPWTDERVIEVIDRVVPDMIREVLENFLKQKPPAEIDTTPVRTHGKIWRDQAKELGIEVYDKVNKRPRLKVDVLKEIAESTNVPEKLQA